jgi:hypothetical protein
MSNWVATSERMVAQTWLLLAAAFVFEVAAIFALQQQPQWMPGLRVVHLLQMAALLLLSYRNFSHLKQADSHWAWQARWLFIALLFAFSGDLINSGLVDLSGITAQRHLLSIPAFAVMQSIYVLLFWRSSSAAASHINSNRIKTLKLASLIVWLPASVLLWRLVFDNDMSVLIQRATLFYVCLVVLMGITSGWLSYVWGRTAYWVTVGAISFMISDALIGIALNQGGVPTGMATHWVWLSYIGAQCLIVRLPVLGARLEAETSR